MRYNFSGTRTSSWQLKSVVVLLSNGTVVDRLATNNSKRKSVKSFFDTDYDEDESVCVFRELSHVIILFQ